GVRNHSAERYIQGVAAHTALEPAGLTSPARIPLRPAAETDSGSGARAGRIPLFSPSPHVPQGYPAKAFAGEVVPFRVVSFREGHDRIGVHLRLVDPSGAESLHVL